MTRDQFHMAMDIILEHHSTEVIINKPKNGFVDQSKYRLQIKSCVHTVIQKLLSKGFTIHLDNGLLELSHI